MRPVEERITQFVHSPVMAWTSGIVAVVLMWMAYTAVGGVPDPVAKGVGLPSPNLWIKSPGLSFFINLSVAVGISWMMMLINTRYNLLRDITRVFAGVFLLMQAALPCEMGRFNGGSLLGIVSLSCIFLLYSAYNKPYFTRYIFLIFCILAAAAMTQYGFVAFIPVFMMGCGQMRVFNPRMFTAIILGVITPLWIAWAFGLVKIEAVTVPDFTAFASFLSSGGKMQFFATVAVTMIVGVTLCIINMIKVLNYNMRSRSYNGFISLLLFATSALTILDFTNMAFYVTLLNVCTAFQVGQFFVINIKNRGYITVLVVVALYLGLYVWGVRC